MSHANTAEPIEMPFGRLTHVGPRSNRVLYGDQFSQGRVNFWVLSAPLKALGDFAAVSAKSAEPVEMSFGS